MFNPKQYRDKAAEYSERGKTASGPNETREFAQLEKSFMTLADNEQWLADHYEQTVHAVEADGAAEPAVPGDGERECDSDPRC